jgi:hypothetical protein
VQGEPRSCNHQGRLWYIEDGYDSVGMRQYADIGLEEDRGREDVLERVGR